VNALLLELEAHTTHQRSNADVPSIALRVRTADLALNVLKYSLIQKLIGQICLNSDDLVIDNIK